MAANNSLLKAYYRVPCLLELATIQNSESFFSYKT